VTLGSTVLAGVVVVTVMRAKRLTAHHAESVVWIARLEAELTLVALRFLVHDHLVVYRLVCLQLKQDINTSTYWFVG